MKIMDKLVELMPPPKDPIEIPTVATWETCERSISELPLDYKYFLGQYGTGVIDGFMWIYSPAAKNRYLDLRLRGQEILDAIAESSAKSPSLYPTSFPTAGGLLPLGCTDNGDTIYWVTEGSPCEWKIAVMDARSPRVYRYDGGLVSFLVSVMSRSIEGGVFPEDFPTALPVAFDPVRR